MRKSLFSRWSSGQRVAGLAAGVAVATGVPAVATAHDATTPKVVGSPKAGKPLFVSTCGVCHKLKAADTRGTIGPNLDRVPLPETVIVKAITNGGASVMTKAQVARYQTQMTPYRAVLTRAQIQNIAAFIYVSTHR
jgi:mono/diheme cytochrome c family protein